MDRNPFPATDTRALIDYEAETGVMTWRARPLDTFKSEMHGKIWNTRFAGKPALNAICQGYKMGNIKWTRLYAHQAAWAFHYGEWPQGKIDHINGDRSDNRIANLRVVDSLANARNVRLHKRNTSGTSGVDFNRGKWRVRISDGTKHRTIGRYASKEHAVAIRKQLEAELGYHPNHGRAGGL